jgi:3-hydroxyacyl-CoA dehydrogenase
MDSDPMKVEDIKKIAVIGAGTMGHGIAQVCAGAGFKVYLRDTEETILQKAMERISLNLDEFIHEGLTTKEKAKSLKSYITPLADLKSTVSDADLIFEAVPELMDLKKTLWREICELAPEHAILATNTSSFSISEIASVTEREDKFVGGHWMLPPHIRPLAEIVRGTGTSEETIAFMKEFYKSVGKVAIVCKDSPGFIVNRLQTAVLSEAIDLVEKGICGMEDVDLVWTHHLGQRYCFEGPFQFMDRAGIDTWHSIFEYLYNNLREEKYKPPHIMKQKMGEGAVGLKSGKGFYDYTGESIADIIDERDKKLLQLLKITRKE